MFNNNMQNNQGNYNANQRSFNSRPPQSSSLFGRKIGFSTIGDLRRVRLDDNGDEIQWSEKNAEYLCVGLDQEYEGAHRLMKDRKAAVAIFVGGLDHDKLLVRCAQVENRINMKMSEQKWLAFLRFIDQFNTKYETTPRDTIMDVLTRQKMDVLQAQRSRWEEKLRASSQMQFGGRRLDFQGPPGLHQQGDGFDQVFPDNDRDDMPDVSVDMTEQHGQKRGNGDESKLAAINAALVGVTLSISGERAVCTNVNKSAQGFEFAVRNDQGAELTIDADTFHKGLVDGGMLEDVAQAKMMILRGGTILVTPQQIRKMRTLPLLQPKNE